MMCGIEIHQRIAGRKLFCNCVPLEQETRQPQHFSRYLHAVRSELGELDSAVRLEAVRGRHIQYEAPCSSCCLVEADEEPPHTLNPEALHAVLAFCSLLGSAAVDEVHVMRKNVIDGSNTSGFQRTAVVGTGGSIQTPAGSLPIQTVCIEEESAGILPAQKEASSYELSRLAIPLVEIATAPNLKSGKEAQEAALAIGTILRKTGMVSRGIGTIRQDLNISIPGGARVEIKGVQELGMIASTVELEVQRQEKLLKLSSTIKQRLSGSSVEATFIDLTEIFSDTRCQLVSKQLKNGSRVLGMKLPSHEGLLGTELAPNRRYGSELADYARSAGTHGLIHSDEDLTKYGFSEDELGEVRIALSLRKGDAFVLVVGEKKKAEAALSEVAVRANFTGVPEETRKANPDGTSSYLRPLPGRARMYPETDIPPVQITTEMLQDAAQAAKETHEAEKEKEELLSSLPDELAKQLQSAKGLLGGPSPSPELSAFALALEKGIDAKLAATTITNILQSLKRDGADAKKLDEKRLLDALLAVKNGIITKAAIGGVLKEMCKEPKISAKDATKKLNIERISGKELVGVIQKEKLDLPALMSRYRLRVDAQEAQEIMKKIKGG